MFRTILVISTLSALAGCAGNVSTSATSQAGGLTTAAYAPPTQPRLATARFDKASNPAMAPSAEKKTSVTLVRGGPAQVIRPVYDGRPTSERGVKPWSRTAGFLEEGAGRHDFRVSTEVAGHLTFGDGGKVQSSRGGKMVWSRTLSAQAGSDAPLGTSVVKLAGPNGSTIPITITIVDAKVAAAN